MALIIKQFETLPLQAALRAIRELLALMGQGRRNNVGFVTLTPNAASTLLIDSRISVDSNILLMPGTANAAAALPTTYLDEVSRSNGQVTILHANNGQTDRVFRYSIDG